MKLLEGLNKIEKKLAKESDSSRSESHKSSEEKRELKVLVGITIIPIDIPIREQTTTQVYPLSEGIRDMGWMSCEEK
jgi:hypothetical protein